jgi:hypothetical protein
MAGSGAGLARDNGRLLARARHGEGRGFDGAEVVLELAVPGVEHPRLPVGAGRLAQPMPRRVRGCGPRRMVGSIGEDGPDRLTIAVKGRGCRDRGPPLNKALDARLEGDGGAAEHPLEVALLGLPGRGQMCIIILFVAEPVALALLQRQVVVSGFHVWLEERRLGALPPGKRDAHASESRMAGRRGRELAVS